MFGRKNGRIPSEGSEPSHIIVIVVVPRESTITPQPSIIHIANQASIGAPPSSSPEQSKIRFLRTEGGEITKSITDTLIEIGKHLIANGTIDPSGI
jgi:hypothetical protein